MHALFVSSLASLASPFDICPRVQLQFDLGFVVFCLNTSSAVNTVMLPGLSRKLQQDQGLVKHF